MGIKTMRKIIRIGSVVDWVLIGWLISAAVFAGKYSQWILVTELLAVAAVVGMINLYLFRQYWH